MDCILHQLNFNQFMSVQFSDSIMYSNTIFLCVSLAKSITHHWSVVSLNHLGQSLAVGNINLSNGFPLFPAQRNVFSHTFLRCFEFLEISKLLTHADERSKASAKLTSNKCMCVGFYLRVWDDLHNSIMSYTSAAETAKSCVCVPHKNTKRSNNTDLNSLLL